MARLHVPSVGHVRRLRLERQRTVVGDVARFLDGRALLGAVPRFVLGLDGLQRLGVGDPGERLRGGQEVDVGSDGGERE